MPAHADLRPFVHDELQRLEDLALGTRQRVSDLREKFVLDAAHPRASLLTSRPSADGFIRADDGSLLFRDASTRLRDLVPADLLTRAMASKKGLEFRWTQIGPADIRLVIELVIWLATTDLIGPAA